MLESDLKKVNDKQTNKQPTEFRAISGSAWLVLELEPELSNSC